MKREMSNTGWICTHWLGVRCMLGLKHCEKMNKPCVSFKGEMRHLDKLAEEDSRLKEHYNEYRRK